MTAESNALVQNVVSLDYDREACSFVLDALVYDHIKAGLNMLAAIQTRISEVEVRDIAVPTRPDAALVHVRAVGICGSDVTTYHRRNEPQSVPDGHEVAGDVVSLASGYEGPVRVGDLVAVDTVLGRACGACVFCRGGLPFHCPERDRTPFWGGGFAEFMPAPRRNDG